MTGFFRRRETALLGFAWICLAVCVFWLRPALSVDEARYLTVAWEMHQTGNYLVPSLNFTAYSHKPPLLFWLVNAAWAVAGDATLAAARTIPFLIAGAFLGATAFLARLLNLRHAASLVSMSVLFLVYTSGLAFDTLMGLWSVLSVIAVVYAARGARLWPWLLFTFCLGMGALTKGPVILIYALPVPLLAFYWANGQIAPKKWYAALALSVAGGFAIGLSWALPAAHAGGEAYGKMLLWGQTAGRVANAFDHQRPFWFYLPFMAAFLLPLAAWPALWRGAGVLKREGTPLPQPVKMALCWLVPVFVVFSIISSKQVHYLVPLLAPLALLAGYCLDKAPDRHENDRGLAAPLILLGLLPCALLAAYVLAFAFPAVAVLPAGFLGGAYPLLALALLALLFLLYRARRLFAPAALLAAASLFTVTAAYAMAGTGILQKYDWRPAAIFLEQHKQADLAMFPKYQGDMGFTARLEKPVEVLGRSQIQAWLDTHPNGIVIMRERIKHGFDKRLDADLAYRQPYRNDEMLYFVRPRRATGQGTNP